MDYDKTLRHILIVGLAIVWLVLVLRYLMGEDSFAFFMVTLYLTIVVMIVCGYISDKSEKARILIVKQGEEKILRMKMESERQLQRERKLELLKNLEADGRYEEAARICDELEMWEKAGEFRRMAKAS